MKTAYWIGAIVIVLIVAILIVRAAGSSHTSTQQSATTTQTDNVNPPVTGIASSTSSASLEKTNPGTSSTAPAAKHFTVNGNDQTADVKVITVAAGTPVSITFGADAGSTYHGGLDFRSSVVNTGTIAPGSTKTISFTATHSFSFTPYWPATNIAKPYTIDVVVH